MTYAFVDRVHRIYGPDEGTPPAELDSDSHLLDARITSLLLGALAVYGYHLDFRNAPQLSADTFGPRYEGEHPLKHGWKVGWALEYAEQQRCRRKRRRRRRALPACRAELLFPAAGFTPGCELLSGQRGSFKATANPAFQTPLATLHPFQGWADKFTTTPPAGIGTPSSGQPQAGGLEPKGRVARGQRRGDGRGLRDGVGPRGLAPICGALRVPGQVRGLFGGRIRCRHAQVLGAVGRAF